MRDIEVIDGELRLLLAIRQTVGEEEGRPPSTRHIGNLLSDWVTEPDLPNPRLTS